MAKRKKHVPAQEELFKDWYNENPIDKKTSTKLIKPKNEAQAELIDVINECTIVCVAGPAGTAKTFISVGCGIEHFLNGKIKKLVISRPVVEAGEKNGFLPGTDKEKVEPFLIPIFESINHFIPKDSQLRPEIDIVPIGKMQGRTFNDAFIIIDEAQNCTEYQLKMILSRLGQNSKIIINGDFTQSFLDMRHQGAFLKCCDRLENLDKQIAVFEFTKEDIVRHPLISKVLNELEKP